MGGRGIPATWSDSTGVPNAVCRLGNVYGPRQSPHGEAGVVSIFAHRLWKGEAPVVFGHGKPTRDYVHVADVVSALLKACGTAGVYNVATGTETDVLSLLAVLQEAAGTASSRSCRISARESSSAAAWIPSRAERELGWKASVPWDEGLRETYHELIRGFETGAAR